MTDEFHDNFSFNLCVPTSSSKVFVTKDSEYQVQGVSFPADKFSVLLKLKSPVLEKDQYSRYV